VERAGPVETAQPRWANQFLEALHDHRPVGLAELPDQISKHFVLFGPEFVPRNFLRPRLVDQLTLLLLLYVCNELLQLRLRRLETNHRVLHRFGGKRNFL
jgi:hypothetical protein